MTNLTEIHGLNTFCGPAVLSALTGRSTDECAAVIQSITGQNTIKGVYVRDMVRALNKLKFDTAHHEGGRTLYGTLIRLSAQDDAFYIIVVPHHYVAIEVTNHRVYLIDNHSKQPLLASGSARLMQRVEQVLKVIPRGQPVVISDSIKVSYYHNQVEVWHIIEFKDPKANVKVKLGNIQFADAVQFDKIIEALQNTNFS